MALFYEFEALGRTWSIREYQLAYLTGFAFATAWMAWRAARKGTPAWLWLAAPVYGWPSVWYGARVLGWITLGRTTANALYGGLFGALLVGAAVWWLFYRRWYSIWEYFDDGMVALILLFAFTRLGCHFSGCCHGTPAPEGWPSVTYPLDTPGYAPVMALRELPLHPAALYEALGLAELLLAATWLRGKFRKGELGWLLLSGYAALRFALEFIRADERGGMVFGLSPSQCISLGVLASAALVTWSQRMRVRPGF